VISKKNFPQPTHIKTRFPHTPRAGPVCLQGIHRLQNNTDWLSLWDTFSFIWRLEVTEYTV